jgi:hypothetical protein
MLFFAAGINNPLDQLPVQPAPRHLLGLRVGDIMLLIGVATALAVALLIWAAFIRKPKRESSERVYNSRPYVEEREDGTIRKRKKRKRQRREHRVRNPTLAEVGGLPPLKSDSTPPV